MQLPDVNVLIYAHREDAPEHERYAAWLQALTTSDEPFALSDVVLSGFLRIVTNPRIFDPATPMDTALAFCERLWIGLALRSSCRVAGTGSSSPACVAILGDRWCLDAYIAALAIEHGCEFVTTDSDFARFPGLRWRHPLAAT
jgi:hypothetical protein